MTLHTEEEAKQRWCPLARVGTGNACNRYPMEHDAYKAEPFAKCIGSACMAWRWGRSASLPALDPNAPMPPEPPRRGYCGAFGRPE